MRTTLEIDDDILQAAKDLAQSRGSTAGRVISDLARQALAQPASGDAFGGIPRLAQVHTTIPSRPRQEVEKYTVIEGDTIFGISEKFGLKPETVLWANYYVLLDDPHALQPGEGRDSRPGQHTEQSRRSQQPGVFFTDRGGAVSGEGDRGPGEGRGDRRRTG